MNRLSQVSLTPELHAAACCGERAACREIYDTVAGPVFALTCRLVGPLRRSPNGQGAAAALLGYLFWRQDQRSTEAVAELKVLVTQGFQNRVNEGMPPPTTA
ncbi:MAG: hypothetical protein H7A18_05745 [Sinobacteraceae bacterium]|nr:hypothetical protein [Nevskiaceae bacterium]MCP5466163.1 hypothetical protein [Nevskiaceae bacterium]MCP5471566.1 hypothetical protein [Nevskiaceae bacterium]